MALTLAEVLHHPRLGITILVAARMNREVRWVHATEQLDPSPYLRGGEIVLTDGLWLDGPDTARQYVQRLRSIDVAALGYGPMPESPNVPTSLITACAEFELCLFAMPPTLPFMAVSEVFVDRFVDDRKAELSERVDRNARFLDAVRSGSGADGLLRLLQVELAGPAWVSNAHGRVLFGGGCGPGVGESEVVRAAVVQGAARRPVHRDGWWVQAIMAPEQPRGYLAVRPAVEEADRVVEIVEQILPFLGMELAHERALRQTQRRFATELIDLVLAGERQQAQVAARLAAAGFDDSRPIAVLVCRPVRDGDPGSARGSDMRPRAPQRWPDDVDDALEVIESVVTGGGVQCVSAARDDQVVTFVSWDRGSDELPELGRELRAGADVIVGIGSLARSPAALRTSLIEARHACRLASARRNGLGYDTYAALGTHQLLLDLQPADVLGTFSGAVLEAIRSHDERHRSELLHTVRRFLELDGQWQLTADDLHVHVNTLRNRLARVEALIGRSLQSTIARVDLFLALRADEMSAD